MRRLKWTETKWKLREEESESDRKQKKKRIKSQSSLTNICATPRDILTTMSNRPPHWARCSNNPTERGPQKSKKNEPLSKLQSIAAPPRSCSPPSSIHAPPVLSAPPPLSPSHQSRSALQVLLKGGAECRGPPPPPSPSLLRPPTTACL